MSRARSLVVQPFEVAGEAIPYHSPKKVILMATRGERGAHGANCCEVLTRSQGTTLVTPQRIEFGPDLRRWHQDFGAVCQMCMVVGGFLK